MGYLRILVIEDNPERLDSLRHLFMHERVRVLAATSVPAAMRTVKGERFDLILLDHDLHESHPMGGNAPYSSGTQVTDALIASPVNRRTRIIVHSMNPAKRQSMCDRLTANGFDVEIAPMDTWTPAKARALVEELLEELEE